MDDGESGEALCVPFLTDLPVSGASISVVSGTGRSRRSARVTRSPRGWRELQFELGEGPTPTVLRTGWPVIVLDLAADDLRRSWPALVPAASDTGARAMIVLPMRVGSEHVGVVSLYGLTSRPAWSDQMLQSAEDLVSAVAHSAVAFATRSAIAERPSGPSQTELRRTVHQAAGMVMVQLDGSIDEALARLRAYAYSEDRPLDLVARDVVSGVLSFTDSDE